MRTKIRLLFFAIVVFLFLQFLYAMKFSEPYPAIKLPGFGNINKVTGIVDYSKFEIIGYTSNNDSIIVEADNLFDKYPKSYILALLTTITNKHNIITGNSSNLSKEELANYKDFKVWLRKRLQTVYSRDIYKVVVNKKEVKRNIETNEPEQLIKLYRTEINLTSL